MTLKRRKDTELFMSWIRSLTVKYKGRLRFVLAGSIGLEPILRHAGLSHTINTFSAFDVLPWDDDTAIHCLQALANNYQVNYTNNTIKNILELLGCNLHTMYKCSFHLYTMIVNGVII